MSDMSNPLAAEKTAVLYRMVMSEHVCPYGLKAKYLLERAGYEVDDRHLTTREETEAFAPPLMCCSATTGQKSGVAKGPSDKAVQLSGISATITLL